MRAMFVKHFDHLILDYSTPHWFVYDCIFDLGLLHPSLVCTCIFDLGLLHPSLVCICIPVFGNPMKCFTRTRERAREEKGD